MVRVPVDHEFFPLSCPEGLDRPCQVINGPKCPFYLTWRYTFDESHPEVKYGEPRVVICRSGDYKLLDATWEHWMGSRLIPEQCPAGRHVCSSSRNGYRCPYKGHMVTTEPGKVLCGY